MLADVSGARAKVLLIDDAREIHALFRVHLKGLPVELLHAYSGREGLEIAQREPPALILLDYRMPDMDGMAVLARLKDDPALAAIPVMLVTATDDPETISRAFALGAADYVQKPVCAAEVKARVSRELHTQQLMSELRRRAYHDILTGLPNRALLANHLQRAIERRRREPGHRFAVLFFDFDRFKNINDSLGHDVGDMLLKEVAIRFERCVPSVCAGLGSGASSTVARLGGDEFVVLLDGLTDPQDAVKLAEELLKALSQSYRLGEHQVFSTASVGIVTSELGHETVDEVLRDADTALYAAKDAGKARFAVFDRSMRTRVQRRLEIENALHQAVEERQFFLLYQPIVSLTTGRLESVEALIRWRHPERGVIAPDQFIPLAEEMGLIVPIGDWVLDEACRQFASWRAASEELAPRSISVNLARQQLLVEDFAQRVDQVLERTGVSRSNLYLEVTESEMMRDVTATTRALAGLKDLGVRIQMDDFGTGHSSLACLRDFPLDVLKIDRSFVVTIGAGRDLMAVLNAIIELAHDLRMKTVAEGIETPEQVAGLQALNCDLGQGYYFARPLPAEEIPRFAAERNLRVEGREVGDERLASGTLRHA
ncbi:MAG TPA: EAL domain-containing protein [Gammaproteobacteria bacterium]